MIKTRENELVRQVDYKINYMHIANHPDYPDKAGVIVHVVETDKEIVGIPPNDDHNLTRYLEQPGCQIIGRGILVEEIGTDWFVAWRPYSPKPEKDYSNYDK